MTHRRRVSAVLITLLGCGFLTNSVASKATDQDTNFNTSKSLVKNTIKPTLLSKKLKGEQLKAFKEDEPIEIKSEKKRISHENSNSQLGN